ncbi:MAG: hypothetical protein LBC61_04770 [Candidatus Peribacteria bacterium]|jgi:hypothetical protein|nr:hypothetical protein [Candidatus Peribacteria bacterium]
MEALKDPKRLASNEFIGEVLSTPYALPAIGILIIVGIFKGGKHRTAALWTLFSFI